VTDLFRSFEVTGVGHEAAELRCLARGCTWAYLIGRTTLNWVITKARWHVEHSHRVRR
jgi:hypothetical protein